MNGLLIAAMVMGGGTGVAMQNQNVNQAVTDTASKLMYQVGNMFKGSRLENVKENGFTGPSEEFLSTLTEDQVFQITSAIDVINATYDWANMTDEEIQEALVLVKAEMEALYAELGIEAPMIQTQTRTQAKSRVQAKTQSKSQVRDSENCDQDDDAGASEDEVETGDAV
jgi:hypothetical protein